MDDMDMASNVSDSASTSADTTTTSEEGVTEGPPNSSTGASASDSEDTPAASAAAASSADCASIVDTVCAMEGVTVFCDVLTEKMLIPGSSPSEDDNNNKSSSSSSSSADSNTASKGYGTGYGRYRRLSEDVVDDALGLNEVSQEFTLFVPTDAAFAKTTTALEQLSQEEIDRVVLFHLYEGMLLTADKLVCGEKIISMNDNGDASRTKCDAEEDHKYQNGNGNTKSGTMPEIKTVDHLACNGVIHTLDAVMFPVSLSELEVDDSDDMSNVDVSKVKLPTFGGVWNYGSNAINTGLNAGSNAINTALNWASF